MQALRHLRQISQEISQPNVTGWGRRPAALRALSQRLSKYIAVTLWTKLVSIIIDTSGS
jgi:hypothetical protein